MEDAIRQIEALHKVENLPALAEEAHALEEKWRGEPAYFARVLQLADTAHSIFFPDRPAHDALIRDIVLTALDQPVEPPAEIAVKLIQHLPVEPDSQHHGVEGEAWELLRCRQAKAWLRGWQRLDVAIDPNFDPDDVPAANLDAPGGLPSGAAPEAVADPDQRAVYDAALAANRAKAERYREQIELRRTRMPYMYQAREALAALYRQPPAARTELDRLLDEFSISHDQRARIFAALGEGR